MKTRQICTKCVMDQSDPAITFDHEGVCHYCRDYEASIKPFYEDADGRQRALNDKIAQIKASSPKSDYNCIIGLSGGVDSSYLALKVHEWGLRPLVVHVDAGWNSAEAVQNIGAIIDHCGFELHTHVVDWEEIKELQKAYLRSGVPHQDVPQDHIFASVLYNFAINNGIKYVLSGGNTATEFVLPSSWQWSAMDAINLHAINRRFGGKKLRRYLTTSYFQYYFTFPFIHRLETFRPLNYIDYNKGEAEQQLVRQVGYRKYKRKHGESVFTKFFQNHYLPERYGYDKRIAHLSSMILSGQITREEALTSLAEPLYEGSDLRKDMRFIADKLDISVDELEAMFALPKRNHDEFPNWKNYHRRIKAIQRRVERLLGRKIRVYS